MEIKDKIYYRRKELGMTLEEVGKIVGVAKSTVRKWETGDIENMRLDKIALLAKALQITPASIMGWEDENGNAAEEGDLVISEGALAEYENLNDENKKRLEEYFRLLMLEQMSKKDD